MATYIDKSFLFREKPEDDPDKKPQMMDDMKPEHNGEFYDGDSDQDGEEENDT